MDLLKMNEQKLKTVDASQYDVVRIRGALRMIDEFAAAGVRLNDLRAYADKFDEREKANAAEVERQAAIWNQHADRCPHCWNPMNVYELEAGDWIGDRSRSIWRCKCGFSILSNETTTEIHKRIMAKGARL